MWRSQSEGTGPMANSLPFFLIPMVALATYLGVRCVVVLTLLFKGGSS